MNKVIDQLIQKYDAATVFVVAATVVVILELSVMRILVPSSATAENIDTGTLMEQVYNDARVAESAEKLEIWSDKSSIFISRLNTQPALWQKELQTTFAFGFEQKQELAMKNTNDDRANQKATADYAASQLYLQSIMTGRIPLANINGKIYRIGGEVPVRDGEIMLIVVEIGSDYAIVQLDEFPDIKRTIYLSKDMQLVNGDRLP